MNVEPPVPPKIEWQQWATVLGFVTAAAATLWTIGTRVVMPLLRSLARRLLKTELDVIEANNKSLGRMWPEQLEQSETLRTLVTGQQELRDMVMRLDGRVGRRRDDPK